MKIGLFGGSFNPPHYGHFELASAFRTEGHLDVLWVLVSPEPPHKAEDVLASYQHRLAMASLLFDHTQGIEINRIEEDLPAPHFTYQTIQALKDQYPQTTFFLCLGEDSLEHFMEWKQPESIISDVELLIARRPGVDANLEKLPAPWLSRIHFINAPLIPISSSDIRKRVLAQNPIEDLLPSEIADYIKRHHLYGSAE